MRFVKFFVIFLIIFGWIFGGWPQVYNFPPEIKVAQAAFPSISTTATTNGTGASATPVVNLPASIVSGNTLIVLVRVAVVGAIGWPSGWTELFDDASDASDDQTAAAWRKADGTEGATITLSSASGKFAAIAWNITGAADPTVTPPQFATLAVGTSVNPNPGSLSPTGGAKDYLWLAVGGWEGEQTSPPATFPTNYTLNQIGANSGTGGAIATNVRVAGGGRQLNAASEDPGTYTISASDDWTATTIAVHPAPITTTLSDGTNPGDTTIGPGGAATEVNSFTFQTSAGTDPITSVTTTLAVNTTSGISKVEITSDNGVTVYGSTTNPTANSFSISLSGLTATSTSAIQYKIRITPKSHANMPAPPGQTFTVTSTITAWTGTNNATGTDTGSATITIDNLSPADVTSASGTAGDAQVSLSWTNPGDTDFTQTVVLRATSSVGQTPAEGSTYSVGNAIGTSTVACVVNSPTASCTDTGLTNGTAYHYKIFTRDTSVNYSAPGVVPTGSPFTPFSATVSCSTNITSASFSTLTTSTISTASPNASTTMTCDFVGGCTLNIQDLNAGLATSSPAYTIPSVTATLSAGTEGYGIQAATTTVGTGGVLGINSTYLKTGNAVGALSLTNLVLASSTIAITNRQVVVTHKAAISVLTNAATYADTITYSCVGN